ncbi:MAG: FecR domain-containing protein [Novosphingobium sp.]
MQKTGADKEQIRNEAAAWIVREVDGDCSASDVAALQSWLGADPENHRIYLEMKEIWALLGDTPGFGPASCEATNDNTQASGDDRPALPFWRRSYRPIIAAGVAASVAAFLFTPATPPKPLHFSTDIAQIKEIRLDDGSTVTLGPMTSVDVVLAGSERRTLLGRGEAYFTIAKDASRPFIVQTSTSSVRVVGTQFNVRDNARVTQIGVVDGTVEIRSGDGSPKSQRLSTLRGGQIAEVRRNGEGRPIVHLRAQTGDALGLSGSWRDGWLVYNDARLADIVDDVNRYYRPGVTVSTPALGERKFTASFRSKDAWKFLRVLESEDDLKVDRQDNGAYRISPRR